MVVVILAMGATVRLLGTPPVYLSGKPTILQTHEQMTRAKTYEEAAVAKDYERAVRCYHISRADNVTAKVVCPVERSLIEKPCRVWTRNAAGW